MPLPRFCRIVVVATVMATRGWNSWAGEPEQVHQPDIVLISLDTVRPDHLGCYGYTVRATSPNLDRFASTAALFLTARCQAPWTLPSHMSLMTSMLPSHNHVEDISQKLADDVPYLPDILHKAGYQTAALVNNGQMKPHWGFARGFDEWREFEVDTPEGMASNITDHALQWLAKPRGKPRFLFLHYYDAHDPYDPPSPYRERFRVTKTGGEIRLLTWQYRLPENPFPDPALLQEIRAAYDAEIAYLDEQVGRLLKAIPPEALVVIFSDHGEAFKEHGWMLHGAELYEEEIRTVLMIRPPASTRGSRIADPVMLLDVAPTILRYADIISPATFEGRALQPALAGQPLPARLHFAETTRTLEGRVLKSVMSPPSKLIYSLPDDALSFYELPDENRRLSEEIIPATLRIALQKWVNAEPYWMIHVKGEGRCELDVEIPRGRITAFVPVGFNEESDEINTVPGMTRVSWAFYPAGRVKHLYFQTDLPEAIPVVAVRQENGTLLTNIFWRAGNGAWSHDPTEISSATNKALIPDQNGVYIEKRGLSQPVAHRPASPSKLDEQTIRQLRSLKYIQ